MPADPAERAAWIGDLTDESGARPASFEPLGRHLAGLEDSSADDTLGSFWASLGKPGADPLALAEPGKGPLLGGTGATIETSTEWELAALHALGAHAVERGSAALWRRLWDAADWHARELQPDNATCRPWAVHVFVWRASWAEDTDLASAAALHASTLLHNCQVSLGRPDRLSACILLDAAARLERAGERPPGA